MDEDRIRNAVRNEDKNTEFNNEEYDGYSTNTKIEDAPKWNEELQKIVVGHH